MNNFKQNIYKQSVFPDIIFDPFDYMVVNFQYSKPENGQDLDIMIYYDGTGTEWDLNAVGYDQGVGDNIKIPFNTTPDKDAYLWWATDDNTIVLGPCVEAVVIGANTFVDQVPVVNDIIDVYLRVGWFHTPQPVTANGLVTVHLLTYLGGIMERANAQTANISGTGTLGFVINGITYSQAFDTNVPTTISNFLTTHTAAILSATNTVITGSVSTIVFNHSPTGFPVITGEPGGMVESLSSIIPGTNIINVGGVLVNDASKTITVTSCCGKVTVVNSNLAGIVHYDKINKTATLT